MKSNPFAKIENATVTLVNKGGQGILVKNKLILTASHCVQYRLEGEMALGNYFIEVIETQSGKFKVAPLAIELLSDIAILRGLDDQEFSSESIKFDEFCQKTTPIKVCKKNLEVNRKHKVFIYCHDKKWISGSAEIFSKDSPLLWVESDEQIYPGTSGSAIINEEGEIIGIVLNAPIAEKFQGNAPRPHLTLPRWICNKI